jgi:hypothetical protein
MPFAGDLPDNNFAAYKAEMVRWKCKWQNVTKKPSTLIDTLKHAKPELYPNIHRAVKVLLTFCCLPAVLGLLGNTFCFSASFAMSWYNSCQTLSSCLIFRRELQIFMPFAGDLPDNNFAAYKAEMVRWKCKWQNVTKKPSTLWMDMH